jgi:predicted HTH transcriptional regulator
MQVAWHRDYTSSGSVQVMLFSDRVEVWNPGALPPSLTIEKLRRPHGSVPANPLLAEALYLVRYIERMGTGTRDMIRLCRAAGLSEPEFSISNGFIATVRCPEAHFTGEVTGEVAGEVTGEVAGEQSSQVREEVARVLLVLNGEMKRSAIQAALKLRHEDHFRDAYLNPALDAGMIEMTIPTKPRSSLQKYRLTARGAATKAILLTRR